VPYGIPKEKGGDDLRNTAKMERCVQHVMEGGKYPKDVAIAICKKRLGFTKEEDDRAR
jgi:hypothetical protein